MANLAEIKKNTVDVAESRIRDMMEKGEIKLPEDYAVGNALKAVWLKLQETKDRSGKPVLQSCTRTSIVNAMLDTAIQGLNPSKDQAYYIAYGNKLTMQRSYFGNIALAKRVADVKEVRPEIIREGDEVEIEIIDGNKKVKNHKTKWNNADKPIAGGYTIIIFKDDKPDQHTIMTIEECKQAWKQGPTYKEDGNGTHQKFTQEMVKKTVINRATKRLIKSSSDSYLFKASVDRADDISTEYDVDITKKEKANTETVDIETVSEDRKVNTETGEIYNAEDVELDSEEYEDEEDDFAKEVEESLK